jgi:hypothetical protein
LIALSVALPASAQSVENQPIDGSSLAAAARQPPPFTVTLMSAKSSHTEVLGRGITTEFYVTNTGIRDGALMNAQIVVKDQNEKVLFRVEWETSRAVGDGQPSDEKQTSIHRAGGRFAGSANHIHFRLNGDARVCRKRFVWHRPVHELSTRTYS